MILKPLGRIAHLDVYRRERSVVTCIVVWLGVVLLHPAKALFRDLSLPRSECNLQALRPSICIRTQNCLCLAIFRFESNGHSEILFTRPAAKHVHFVPEDLLAEGRFFVVRMPYFFLHNVLFRTFRLFYVFFLCQDLVHFWPKANTFRNWHSVPLVFHFS